MDQLPQNTDSAEDNTIKESKTQVEAAFDSINETLKEILDERIGTTIAQLNAIIERLDEELTKAKETIDEKDNEISRLQDALQAAEGNADGLRDTVIEKDDKIKLLQEEVDAAREDTPRKEFKVGE